MRETWCLDDDDATVDGAGAQELCRRRLANGTRETCFTSSTGRWLMFVTNGPRAMLMLLQWPDDDGEHLGDALAGVSESTGYVLSNGQHDTYPDADTAPLGVALQALGEVIDGVDRSQAHHWIIDRAEGATDWRIQPDT